MNLRDLICEQIIFDKKTDKDLIESYYNTALWYISYCGDISQDAVRKSVIRYEISKPNIFFIEINIQGQKYYFNIEKKSKKEKYADFKGFIIHKGKKYDTNSDWFKNQMSEIQEFELKKIQNLLQGYDFETMYIDDGNEFRRARAKNDKIIATLKSLKIPKQKFIDEINTFYDKYDPSNKQEKYSDRMIKILFK